jgi:hypothetical protein
MRGTTLQEWLERPATERAQHLSQRSPADLGRYVSVSRRLWRRYTVGGFVTVSIGGRPSRYTALDEAAYMRYAVGL